MQKVIYLVLSLLVIITVSCLNTDSQQDKPKRMPKNERIEGAIEFTKMTSSDVETGEIPQDKLLIAIKEGERRLRKMANERSNPESITNAVWRERGPSNRGGRTRAIMIDSRNSNRIWTGGVSGGLWRSEDITQNDPQWQKLGTYFPSLAIADIKQHPQDPNTIYVATGESYTSDVPGAGLFRSTDDGATWENIPSTQNSVFRVTNELLILENGDIYVATSNSGLMRSQDGAETWTKVIGQGVSGGNGNNIHDLIYNKSNQTIYISNNVSVFKSTTGNVDDWVEVGRNNPGFPTNVSRVELTVCPSDPDIMYVIGNVNSFSSSTFFTENGGETWAEYSEPAIFFGYGQAWYDLEITVDPSNCFRLLAGGVVLSESISRGFTWRDIAENVHADHHNITFDEKILGRTLFGNDGGIWFSSNSGITTVDKSQGYITTQFYACAMHPDAGSPYIMGGTQDNNSLIIDDAGLSPSRTAWGGDGVFCFIDQNEPNIQIVSSQNGNYGLSLNGGLSFGLGSSITNADFINRSGYDNDANILYGQSEPNGVSDIDYFRWKIDESGLTEYVDITNYNLSVTAVLADPNFPNRVYFGGQGGIVVQIDDANTGLAKQGIKFADFPGTASVSSIYMDKQTSDHCLVSMFNYGASLENLYVTYNKGVDWVAIEGDLPDLPIRWAMFDPSNHDRAMIATDAGVWVTDDINGSETHWVPSNPDNGMPFVRVDMLVMRESDKVVLAGTYGRGLMTTDIFAAPAAVIVTQEIAYEGQPITIDGSQSVNAATYEWNFGDNTTSTDPEVVKTFDAPGNYTVSLTINGSITQTRNISILPYLPAPYQEGDANYHGDFESSPEHFAGYLVQGTPFERGKSTHPGKDGTHSGNSAWVLGVNDALYQNNTRAELYTPMYDMTEPGLYEFKFWSKYAVQNRNDGFQVEYSLNAGATWQQLGTRDDIGWYNYQNINLTDAAFPMGRSYFTNAQLTWTQYIKDISLLAGNAKVSFRFVFRSDSADPAQGVAIDDVQLTKYTGDLKTTVTVFDAAYNDDGEVEVTWTTGLEYHCKRFEIERSLTGLTFGKIATVNAKGGTSTFPREYEHKELNVHNLIYYRMKVINENTALGYYYEFYTDTVIVRRNVEANIVHHVLTNPFTDKIHVTFTGVIHDQVTARLYDMSGKLLVEDIASPHSIAYVMDNLSLIPGVYVFSLQIGEEEPKTYKLLSLGN
jgi:hypothetical protein